MTTIFIDIETIPPAMSGDEKRELAALKVPKNIKKEETRAKWLDANADKTYKRLGLDSMRGQVCVIGWAIDGGPVQTVGGTDEEQVMRAWADAQDWARNAGATWVGHNLCGFDLPWLWRRAVKYNLTAAQHYLPHEKWAKNVYDTYEQWVGIERRGAFGTGKGYQLDAIARYLDVGAKTDGMDGSQVYDYVLAGRLDEVQAYCADDVELVRNVWMAMTGREL